jgi:hypothetical protein
VTGGLHHRKTWKAEISNTAWGNAIADGAKQANDKAWFNTPGTGKLREMGLGNPSSATLAKARELAQQCRADLVDGLDPIGEPRCLFPSDAPGLLLFLAATIALLSCRPARLYPHRHAVDHHQPEHHPRPHPRRL